MRQFDHQGFDGSIGELALTFRIEHLSRFNQLSTEENRKLFEARSLAQVIGLTLTGLGRLARHESPPTAARPHA